MNKPIHISKIYNFDKPIVYIADAQDKNIGYIQMDNEQDLIELAEMIETSQENK